VITAEHVLSNVVAWATREANVRRLVLVGSRARAEPLDELADIDLQVYVETSEPYARDNTWLPKIGQPWLCVRDEYSDADVTVPTRLVIFEGGMKVDFAFYPAGVVSDGARAGLAHRVLLDKDAVGCSGATGKPSPLQPEPPSDVEFRRVVDEFWFEAYHVAKYLARNELWLAKSRDWATKRFLWRMIEWHEHIARGHVQDAWCEERRSAFSDDTWEALYETFSGFARGNSWRATFATIDLFQRLAADVAAILGFSYPTTTDRNMSQLIIGLRGDDTTQPRVSTIT